MPMREDLPTTYAGLLHQEPGVQDRSPTRPRAPSRCRTCRTRSRSGRPSATPTPSSVIFGKTPVDQTLRRCDRQPPASRVGHQPTRPAIRARQPHAAGSLPVAAPARSGSLFVAPVRGVPGRPSSPTRSASRCGSRFHDYFFAAPGAQVARPFVGLDNYTDGADRPGGAALVRATSPIFLVINVPLTVVLSLVLATALNAAIPFRTFFRVAYYVPYVTASVAVVGGLAVPVQLRAAWSTRCSGPLAPNPSWLVNSRAGDAVDRALRHLEAARLLHPALPGRAAERPQGALRVGRGRRRGAVRTLPDVTVPGVRPGDHAGGDPGDDHRREPVHRALPAHQRRRPGRRVDLAGAR